MTSKNILFVVITIAFFLRFWHLGDNPPSLAWDEAAWGYNAYTLGIDGRDEFGKLLPLVYIESFGDYKPPVYAYLSVVPVKLFGLTEFAVRFPSAFFGVLTVLVTYSLVKRIFPDTKYIALLSAFFLSISPWHINLSRAAFEANVATFFLVTGVWLFVSGVVEQKGRGKWYFIFSAISFVLSMYTFNTSRIVAPLLVAALAIGFRKQLFVRKKEVLIAVFVGIILFAPLFRFLLTPEARLRFQEVNIFSDVGVIARTNKEIINDDNAWWSKVIHNRRVAFVVEYTKHYLDHFNPDFLFIKGDGNPKFSTQDVGQLYLWELPFFVAGILFLLRKKAGFWWIIPAWLLIALIPAGTARETPHALRIETALPTFQIIVALGVTHAMEFASHMRAKNILYGLFAILLAFNVLYYLHGYHTHYPREFSGEWQYGYKETVLFTKEHYGEYEKFFITNAVGRPYIYYLFYNKTSPQDFRKTAQITKDPQGFTHVDGFGKYVFTNNVGEFLNPIKPYLYLDTAGRVATKAKVVKEFYLLNGYPIYVTYRFY